MIDPLLEDAAGVLVCTSALRRSRRTVNADSLTRHRVPAAQPLVQQINVLNLALDIPVGEAVLLGKCRALVENLLVIAGAVDDDAVALLNEVLGLSPLKLVGIFCGLVERNVGFKKRGSEDIVIDNYPVDGVSEHFCHRTLPRARRTRHLDEEFVWCLLLRHFIVFRRTCG